MDKKSHKPGLGSSSDVTSRHIETRRQVLRKNRETKLSEKRRVVVNVPETPLAKLIASIPQKLQSHEDVQTLNRVLQLGDVVEPYYSPSNLFPECSSGPWIFSEENDPKIMQLMAILKDSKDISLLRTATNCLINIAGHQETKTWAFQLHPVIPFAIALLLHCGDATVKENVLWMFANLCFDNGTSRDLILNHGLVNAIVHFGEDDIISLKASSFVFRSLFKHFPLPPISVTAPLWKKLIPRLYETPDNDLRQELLGGIDLMLRSKEESYKMAMLDDPLFWKYITSNPDLAKIITRLSCSYTTHKTLLDRGAIQYFTQLLNCRDPLIRMEGGLGLSNMAESEICLPHICNETVLNALQRQVANCDVFNVRKQVYWVFICLIRTAHHTHKQSIVYPILMERKGVRYLCDAIRAEDNELREFGLCAIAYLIKWNKRMIKEELEEDGGLDYIEHDLATHMNERIRATAETLLEVLEQQDMDIE